MQSIASGLQTKLNNHKIASAAALADLRLQHKMYHENVLKELKHRFTKELTIAADKLKTTSDELLQAITLKLKWAYAGR